MQEMMAEKMEAGAGGQVPQMPEMMLEQMMPHCIGMMLPRIDVEKRSAVAAGILSSIVEKGSVGMSDEQARSFLSDLEEVLKRSA